MTETLLIQNVALIHAVFLEREWFLYLISFEKYELQIKKFFLKVFLNIPFR